MADGTQSEDHRWAEKELDNFGEYCFETDQLALKGNEDYQNLLKTLVKLEVQRMTAVQNMEKLEVLKAEALKDPLKFVEKLQRNEDLGFPPPQIISDVPDINWSQYGVNIPDKLKDTKGENSQPSSVNHSDNELSKEYERGPDGKLLVRGREFNQKKPETFNQLWTPEEQKRLQELLIIHPHETVEMERFRKIAKDLGNRTPLQVQSRVQKYFIKLQKAGMPVPGRTYNYNQYSNSRKGGHRHQRHNRHYFPTSTFWASSTPSVLMNEQDDAGEPPSYFSPETKHSSLYEDFEISDEDVPEQEKNSDGYAELMWLKLLKRVKTKQSMLGKVVHTGFRCDSCGTEPITGVRWNCPSCPLETSTDICDRCILVLSSKAGHHQVNHQLIPILKVEPSSDGPNYLLQSTFKSDV